MEHEAGKSSGCVVLILMLGSMVTLSLLGLWLMGSGTWAAQVCGFASVSLALGVMGYMAIGSEAG